MTERARLIYKIEQSEVWAEAMRTGRYLGSEHDRRDGFIHFSTAAQAAETAAKHFSRRAGLIIAAIDATALGPALKWEAARGGALFPHLHAALDSAHVLWSKPLPLDADGNHMFPEEMA